METTYYKGDKITTFGLSSQHIFEIKEDYHFGLTIQQMALKYCLTIDQINYAILLNE